MRYRIGYGGPRGYRHGNRGPRPHGGNMSEFERLIHLVVSLQILFGSRRGGLLLPLIIVCLAVGGWYAYNHFLSADNSLRKADILWDSGDTENRNEAIRKYKLILRSRDKIETHRWALRSDRDRLYRRIIEHHLKYDGDKSDARDWVKDAYDEGMRLRDMNFGDQELEQFWNEVTGELKRKDNTKKPNRGNGKYENLPGLDGSFKPSAKSQFQFA